MQVCVIFLPPPPGRKSCIVRLMGGVCSLGMGGQPASLPGERRRVCQGAEGKMQCHEDPGREETEGTQPADCIDRQLTLHTSVRCAN